MDSGPLTSQSGTWILHFKFLTYEFDNLRETDETELVANYHHSRFGKYRFDKFCDCANLF